MRISFTLIAKESPTSMFDYHVHTTQSADCSTPMLDSCAAAIRAGVKEIAFTDHIEHEPADMSFGFFNYTQYMEDIKRSRERFGGQLTILAGAEVDFNVGIASQVEHPGQSRFRLRDWLRSLRG
jgi:histidinol-phosphatase (PHP family)